MTKLPPQADLAMFVRRFLSAPLACSPEFRARLYAFLRTPVPLTRAGMRALWGLGDDEPAYVLDNNGLARIPISGALVNRSSALTGCFGLTTYEDLADTFAEALADPAAAGIVLDVDSPGGEVDGLFDLVDEIYSARGRKPLAAIIGGSAYSAAYALASAASRVYVSRTGGVGSIGILTEHADYSAMLEQLGIRVTAIFAGDRKNDASPWEPLSPEARAEIQKQVDSLNELFAQTVARDRGMSTSAVLGQQAAIYLGVSGAMSSGLADVVMSPADATTDFASRVRSSASTRLGITGARHAQTSPSSALVAAAVRGANAYRS